MQSPFAPAVEHSSVQPSPPGTQAPPLQWVPGLDAQLRTPHSRQESPSKSPHSWRWRSSRHCGGERLVHSSVQASSSSQNSSHSVVPPSTSDSWLPEVPLPLDVVARITARHWKRSASLRL